MIYIYSLIMICAGIYTFTYGVSLWRDDKNKLGGFGAVLIAVTGTIMPMVVLFMKR